MKTRRRLLLLPIPHDSKCAAEPGPGGADRAGRLVEGVGPVSGMKEEKRTACDSPEMARREIKLGLWDGRRGKDSMRRVPTAPIGPAIRPGRGGHRRHAGECIRSPRIIFCARIISGCIGTRTNQNGTLAVGWTISLSRTDPASLS